MGVISDAQKEDLRRRVPLEDLLPEYNVQLVRSGRKYKGLCPFHKEKTPSFWVDPERQFYHCFGCQEAGDVFRFVQVSHGVGFREALTILARRAGIVLEEIEGDARQRARLVPLYDAHELAVEFYHRVLLEAPQAEAARAYLRRRRISEEMWSRFRLGFSLPLWDALCERARKAGSSDEVLVAAGLARTRDRGPGVYDAFRGRVMFPIHDAQKRCIGFGARTLGDEQPKYLNTPKTAIFDKSQVLYGLHLARAAIRSEGAIGLAEGYTDVIALHQAGLEHFVASLGTAFTEENARQLHRIAPRVLLVFDGDAAGQRALERSLDLLVAEDLDVRIHVVKEGKDPCDAVLHLGGDEFRRRLVDESRGLFEFKWDVTVGAAANPAERAHGVDACLRLVARLPNPVARRLVVRGLAERARVPESDLAERLERLAGSAAPRGGSGGRARTGTGPAIDGGRPVPGALPGVEREQVAAPRFELSDLGRTVLRCLITLPAQAATIWSGVPRGLFPIDTDRGRELAETVESLLERDAFSGAALARAFEDSELCRVVVELVESLPEDADTEEAKNTWDLCQRDIRRWEVRARIEELDRAIREARSAGDETRLRASTDERRELMKEMKRRQPPGRAPEPSVDAVLPR